MTPKKRIIHALLRRHFSEAEWIAMLITICLGQASLLYAAGIGVPLILIAVYFTSRYEE
jgi:hypothetical protein